LYHYFSKKRNIFIGFWNICSVFWSHVSVYLCTLLCNFKSLHFFACGDPNTNADLGIEKLETRKEEKRFAGSFSWVLETCMRTRINLKVVCYGRVCGENYLRVTGELGQQRCFISGQVTHLWRCFGGFFSFFWCWSSSNLDSFPKKIQEMTKSLCSLLWNFKAKCKVPL